AAIVLAVRRLQGKPELILPPVTLVDVEVVIIAKDADHILRIDRAAKELHRIIAGVKAFHVLDRGTSAYGAQGERVDLLVGQDHGGGVTNGDIAEHAGIVVVVVAAEAIDELPIDLRVGQSFEEVIFRGSSVAGNIAGRVQDAAAIDDHATPEVA